jgi:serine/threonine protein kinase/DNA-binding CsgD family transcriptional regulator
VIKKADVTIAPSANLHTPATTGRRSMAFKTSPPHLIHRRYRLEEWLGQGSVGMVYRARDQDLDRPVVIKFLNQGEGDDAGREALSARFLREARTVAHLSHPNIMAIYDMGQEQGWQYLVLELVSGGDLRALLRQRGGQLPPAEAITIADSILQALVYAHEQGIIHRDIKPENILLTPAGQVKVADFSLARGAQDARLTQEGSITGTLAYLAPECLQGSPSDARADLYSLGCVFYELLTGRPPFVAENLGTLVEKILRGSFDTPQTLNPNLPPPIEQFILCMLNHDPEQRYPSAAQALAELTQLRANLDRTQPHESGSTFLLFGANDTLANALETDRRQLAGQLQASIIDPLRLLLAQAATFEQTLPGQPAARMAVSVLSSLARQVYQQANDLESSLRPTILETMGLEPALTALADRYERSYGLKLALNIKRLPQRPPPTVELAFFRLIQDVLETLRIQELHKAQLSVQQDDNALLFDLFFPATLYLSEPFMAGLRQRIEPIGGQINLGRTAQGQAHLAVRVALRGEIHFTPQEQQVLDGLVRGLSNKAIAQQLCVSPRTVNYHLDNIFTKLGVRTRTEAAVIALHRGWARRPSSGHTPG